MLLKYFRRTAVVVAAADALLDDLILSLSSSHGDVVEMMTIFDCVLGLSDSIRSISSKNGVFFLLVVAFHVFLSSSLYWRYAVTRVRRVLQASPSRSSYPQANFLPYWFFPSTGRQSLLDVFVSPFFEQNSSLLVLPRSSANFFCSRHFEAV